jgi:predicted transcriptional regulator
LISLSAKFFNFTGRLIKMDIQTKKLHFVQEFLRIEDEKIIDKLNNVLKLERKLKVEKQLKPFTIEEFNAIIDRAEADSKAGRLISAQEMKKEMDSWG